jgi:signal transduction histidine kinase
MFRSARLKLTLFYLVTLFVFSLTLTSGIRLFAEYELHQSIVAQRGEFRSLARNGLGLLVPNPERTFNDAQDYQADLARNHLNRLLVLLNLFALLAGGLVSYWFAGRTLKPIAESHAAQARFVADASHELRTPLANIRAENEVFLRQKTFDANDTRDLIKSNLEEVQRLENLSRDLLALTQYGQTELQLPLDTVPVRSVVAEALAQTATLMKDKDVKIKQQVAKGSVLGHQESLVRLLIILLDNAVKYGADAGTIYIAGAQHGPQYVLTVRDEGHGIADHDLPRIFDRLYRGDSSRTRAAGKAAASGYGLGLALAREIVQANQASIKAYNYETTDGQGKGAVFSVQFQTAKA